MSDSLVVYKDSTGQPVTDQIKVGNKPLDITGSTVTFNMRESFSDTVKVSSAGSIVDATKGQISYEWQAADVDTQGEYKAWWELDLFGAIIETEEFEVIVAEHEPGLRTNTGAVYRAAMSYLPSTWLALEQSPTYGDSMLQEKIEYVKYKILGESVAVADEASLDIRVLNYIAKNVVVQVIPAAVDYWLDQKIKVQLETGGASQEIYHYEERTERLLDLLDKLLKDIDNDTSDIEDLLGKYNTRSVGSTAAYAEGQDEGFVTPSPVLNYRDYAFPKYPGRNNGRSNY